MNKFQQWKSVDWRPNQLWSVQKLIEFVYSWMDTQYFLRSYQFLMLVMNKISAKTFMRKHEWVWFTPSIKEPLNKSVGKHIILYASPHSNRAKNTTRYMKIWKTPCPLDLETAHKIWSRVRAMWFMRTMRCLQCQFVKWSLNWNRSRQVSIYFRSYKFATMR